MDKQRHEKGLAIRREMLAALDSFRAAQEVFNEQDKM